MIKYPQLYVHKGLDKIMEKGKNKSGMIRIAIISMVVVLMFFSVSVAFAQLINPIEHDKFEDFLAGIINFLFGFGLAIAPLFFIIAAFYFLTAGGDPKQIETGKRIIIYTLIGLVVIFMAGGLVALVRETFL